jgi:thioredoxin reductase (NADPH)
MARREGHVVVAVPGGRLIPVKILNAADYAAYSDMVITGATGLTAQGPDRMVRTGDGSQVAARAVILATGVTWRRLGVPALEALVGAGVFYGAAGAEALAMAGRDVFVVGAGNSAGQAAIHLAKYTSSVTMVVRGPGLSPACPST